MRSRRTRCSGGPAASGTRDVGLRENAPQCGAAEGDAFLLLEQLGEVGVVGARVALGGEAHDGDRDRLRGGVVGAAAAVAVGERFRATLPVGGEQPPRVALVEVHQRGSLPDRDLLLPQHPRPRR